MAVAPEVLVVVSHGFAHFAQTIGRNDKGQMFFLHTASGVLVSMHSTTEPDAAAVYGLPSGAGGFGVV
jgi:hypothetical protein